VTVSTYRNTTVVENALPIAGDTPTAIRVVVAQLLLPALHGDYVDISSKVEVANHNSYLVMVAGYLQAVDPNGKALPAISRPMGENVAPPATRKYYCDIQLAKFSVPFDGMWTFQHVLYAASTAYVPGDQIDVNFLDIQAAVLEL